jgi:RNA polymerase sigma-70 factor (ECF subfamily)
MHECGGQWWQERRLNRRTTQELKSSLEPEPNKKYLNFFNLFWAASYNVAALTLFSGVFVIHCKVTMNRPSDEQLVWLYIKRKDEHALEDLIKRYLPLIYAFARNYTGNRDNAADITQETFVKVWKNIKRFDKSKSFRTWIFTIAKHTAIDWLRKKNALPFSAIQDETKDDNFENSLADDSPLIIEQLMFQETSKKLSFALARLPGDYNAVVNLRINDDLNFREIAERLKKPLNTVKSHYRRGISLLKKILLTDSHKKG